MRNIINPAATLPCRHALLRPQPGPRRNSPKYPPVVWRRNRASTSISEDRAGMTVAMQMSTAALCLQLECSHNRSSYNVNVVTLGDEAAPAAPAGASFFILPFIYSTNDGTSCHEEIDQLGMMQWRCSIVFTSVIFPGRDQFVKNWGIEPFFLYSQHRASFKAMDNSPPADEDVAMSHSTLFPPSTSFTHSTET